MLFRSQIVSDNVLNSNSSYDGPFCITAPNDPNLPNGGNYQVCGLYDIKPTARGNTTTVRKLAKDYGGITNQYDGFDVSVNGRFAGGTFVQGGINAQRRLSDTCKTDRIDDPTGQFCHTVFPFRPDVKIIASRNLVWGVNLSGTYQFSQGPNVTASWAVPNALIKPTLGRDLAAGATATKTVALMQPGQVYGENLNQLDLRGSKRFKGEHMSTRIDLDLYNVFNSNWPFSLNTTFSTAATSNWLRPTNVLQGRLFKMGAQFSF